MVSDKEVYKPVRAEPGFFYGYMIVVAAFFMMALFLGIFNAFGVFFKPLLTEFGWTRAETSAAFSVGWITQGFLTIIVGRFNDRFGPRAVLTFCGIVFGLGYLLMSQINALWQLYLFYAVLIATGMSGSFVPLSSTVVRWFVKRRSMMTGIVLTGMGIGIFVAPPTANWLISIYDWRVSYIIMGGIALVVIVLLAQLLRRDPAQVGQKPYGENIKETVLNWGTASYSLREAVFTRQFWLIFGMFLCLGFCLYTILVHIVAHATDLGFTAASGANIMASIGGVGIIGKLVFGGVGDRFGNRKVFLIAFLLMAASLFWLVPAREAAGLYLFAGIFGLAYGGMTTSVSPLVAGLFGLGSHGLVLGVANFGFCVGAAVGPFAAGYIFDLTGSYQTAFQISAAMCIVGVVLASVLGPTKKLGGRI